MDTSGHIPPGISSLTDVDGTEDFTSLIDKLAKGIVQRQLTVPAIIFLESIKPLSFLGNQLLIFANPVVSLVVSSGEYYRFVRMIEDRENIEKLTLAIEEENARDATLKREQKASRKALRKERGSLWSRLFRGRGSVNKKEVDGGGQQGDHQDTGD